MSRYSTLSKISLNIPNSNRSIPGYKTIKYPEITLSDNDIWVITTEGDRLDILANQFYGKDDYWWIIAIANPDVLSFNSIYITPGAELRIPTNYESIISQFARLNS